jgi:hypothetical protein
MAFTVTDDHAHQEQVWEAIGLSYNNQPHVIRRRLGEFGRRLSRHRRLASGNGVRLTIMALQLRMMRSMHRLMELGKRQGWTATSSW